MDFLPTFNFMFFLESLAVILFIFFIYPEFKAVLTNTYSVERDIYKQLNSHFLPNKDFNNTIYCPISFERKKLQEDLKELLEQGGNTWIYYSSEGEGKTYALLKLLQNKKGILHLPFQNIQTTEEISLQLCHSIDYKRAQQYQKRDLNFVLSEKLIPTIKQYYLTTKTPVLILLENVETCTPSYSDADLVDGMKLILTHLLELNRKGIINLLFTVSETRGIELLTKQKGLQQERYNLQIKEFPSIPKQELFTQLQHLLYKKEKKSNSREFKLLSSLDYTSLEQLYKIQKKEGLEFVFSCTSEIDLFIETLGSNMLRINRGLEMMIERKYSVKEVISTFQKLIISKLQSVFNYGLHLPHTISYPEFQKTTLILFLSLLKNEDNNFNYLQEINLELVSFISVEKLNTIIHILMKQNLIQKIDEFTIKFYSPLVLSSFQQIQNDPTLTIHFKTK